MFCVLVYDIPISDEGKKRWQKVFKRCKTFGYHVQNSVFEFDIDYDVLLMLMHDIENILDKSEDSIRIYMLGKKRTDNNVILLGKREYIESNDNNVIF